MPNPRFVLCLFAVVPMLVISALFGCRGESASMGMDRGETAAAVAIESRADTLAGRLLLPGEGGRRGVELHVWVKAPDGGARQIWILPEDDGRFERAFDGEITRIIVFAGREVHRIGVDDLPNADEGGRIDVGNIDLRKALIAYRVHIRGTDGTDDGFVRAALSVGPWHTGPRGELPSLGSKQFPTRTLGRVAEWLLPPGTDDVYFLVERPADSELGTDWRSGEQRVFGPYQSTDFPIELVLD